MSDQILDEINLEDQHPRINVREDYYTILEIAFIILNILSIIGTISAGIMLFGIFASFGARMGSGVEVLYFIVIVGGLILLAFLLQPISYLIRWRRGSIRYQQNNDETIMRKINSSYFSGEVIITILFWGLGSISPLLGALATFGQAPSAGEFIVILLGLLIGPAQVWFMIRTKKHVREFRASRGLQ